MKLRDLMNENNRQDLYHFCGIETLFKIIESDRLGALGLPVSLTRNKNFNQQSQIFNETDVRFTINTNKLQQRYKLIPYHWGADKFYNRNNDSSNSFEDQSEEQTTKPISGFKDFVKETTVKEINLWDYLDEDNWQYLTSVCRFFKKDPEDISYNDLETYLLKSEYKVKII